MSRLLKHTLAFVAFAGLTASSALAIAADRTADEILKELATVSPKLDPAKARDATAVRQFRSEMQKVLPKRLELIRELYKAAPENEQLVTLLPERWMNLQFTGATPDAGYDEVVEVLAHNKNEKLRLEGSFHKARFQLIKGSESGKPELTAMDEFIKLAPKDPRSPNLLYGAVTLTKDSKAKAAIEDRLVKEFPESMYAGMISGARRQREQVGKPFDLEFTDAIKGSTVSIKGLKGKVVVIDFWATWCNPCVAEMPKMKKIYAEYHDKGVEFIGVSLDQPKDQGGLEKLKKFVKDNEIAWPQYYQGDGWQSEFSKSWGINSIPCMFIVDQDGKLASVEARQHIETLIPELLKKNAAPAGAGTGAGGQ